VDRVSSDRKSNPAAGYLIVGRIKSNRLNMATIPKKLRANDEIRIISPATSLAVISSEVRKTALTNLGKMNFKITFSKNAEECDTFSSSSIESRIEDLHDAFLDPNVKGILTTLGGYNSNQLLRYLDYDMIASHPKILCGYSDITAIATAIHAKTGLVTYSGPHFSTFGMRKGLAYTIEAFKRCLLAEGPYTITPSKEWSDDPWYRDQENRVFEKNDGYVIINEGRCEGTILGGNLCTLNLLQGTEYMPSLANSILLIEDDSESQPLTFDRDLQSLSHQPGFSEVKGVIIGRFQRDSNMTNEHLEQIIRNKRELWNIPVITNADFGHTTPQITFPIGGKGKLIAEDGHVEFSVLEH
jgi:muramoyltetrapeptide carboxypeptidase LdcA involved in peptidoglycan recycling